MQALQTITIKEYLARKNIAFRESGKELTTRCVFNDCDKDSMGAEAHLYFSVETGQYDCKKCGAKGNLVTFAKHFGDGIKEIVLNHTTPNVMPRKSTDFDEEQVETCHLALPIQIRQYLNGRGIADDVIDTQMLGYGKFYSKNWITIPIKDVYGNYAFFKLRQDPAYGNDKITFPKGIEAQIYDWEMLKGASSPLVICEGEMDRLALLSKGISAVTSTHGAMTFKQEWIEKVGKGRKIYICYDNDEAGKKGSERVAKLLENTGNEIFIVTLPQEVGEGGDITDYLIKLKGDVSDIFGKYAKEYPEKVDTSQFEPLSLQELVEILGLTIKKDEKNKIVTFLCELSAYTENAQFNISYNAPSSTGKSFIPLEISKLFPNEDVMRLGNCSPTAFFHEQGEFDKDKNTIVVDLSRKIIIFLDQPHTALLERLRSLLSHDEKEMHSKITDKNQRGGNRTKTVIIRGFPSVIFCTAGLHIDEQEATRFLLLSPEINPEKIRGGIVEAIKKESDKDKYEAWLEENPMRKILKERIRAIKLENIREIKIASYGKIEERFLGNNKVLKPRHQRDIKRLSSLIKSFALLNLWWRDRDGSTITANEDDIEQAFRIWDDISVSQELNLPPYIYNLYREVIMQAWQDKNASQNQEIMKITGTAGLSRQEILQRHFEVYGRMLDNNQLRQQILPMLETAGLISQEADKNDKRKILVYPTVLTIKSTSEKNNSVTEGGVDNYEADIVEDIFDL